MKRRASIFWIWVVIVWAYPLLVWPWVPGRVGAYFAKLVFLGIWLVFFTSWGLWQSRNLSWRALLLNCWKEVKLHFPVMLALLYALWIIIASFFSPFPALSLTGSADDYQDGALAEILVIFLGIAAYFGGREASRGVRVGLIAASLSLALLATLEVLLRRGLYYSVSLGDLPLGTFPGKGHLAGFLLLGIPSSWPYLWPTLFVGLALGLTYTRAAFGGLGAAWLAGFFRHPWPTNRHVFIGLVAGISILAGVYLGQMANVEGGKDLGSSATWETRLILWQTAWRALQERPWTGFGGGVFYLYWTDFISKNDLARLLWLEDGLKVLDVRGRAILAEQQDGQRVLVRTEGWKAHNELLDLALMWGWPGASLFALLFILALVRGIRGGEIPLTLGLLGYGVFLLLWYAPFEVKGVLWPVMGVLWGATRKPREPKDFNE